MNGWTPTTSLGFPFSFERCSFSFFHMGGASFFFSPKLSWTGAESFWPPFGSAVPTFIALLTPFSAGNPSLFPPKFCFDLQKTVAFPFMD